MNNVVRDQVLGIVAGLRGEKRASRGTVFRLVGALGGGARGRHYLDVLRNGIGRWLNGGQASRAPSHLQYVVGNLLRRTGLPARRVYGVIDPTGRLGRLRDARALSSESQRLPTPDSQPVESWWEGVRRHKGGGIFEPMPRLRGRTPSEDISRFNRGFADEAPSPEYMQLVGIARNQGNKALQESLTRSWTAPLTASLGLGVPAATAQVSVLPGESAVQAVRRDLLGRLYPGTALSSPRGQAMVRHSRLALNNDGGVEGGGIFGIGTPKLKNGMRQYVTRNSNSGATPAGVQAVGARVGDTVTYQPDVLMHEYGHMIQDFSGNAVPGASRRYARAMGQVDAAVRKYFGRKKFPTDLPRIPKSAVTGRSDRAFNRRYAVNPGNAGNAGDEGALELLPLPPAAGFAGDPIQLFRRLGPTVYGEVAADANAFGTNSRAWPHHIRRALGTYLGSVLQDQSLVARMPGDTLGARMRALRDYAGLARGFANAPEIPYTTAWGGSPRWGANELLHGGGVS